MDVGELKKNVLVTGRPGIGKTTLAEKVAAHFGGVAGGFFTREIRERGRRVGFALETLDGRRDILAHVDFTGKVRVGKYIVNTQAIDRLAVEAIEKALGEKQLVIIDEIGRMELASERFRQAVLKALDSDCIVFATIHQHPDPFTDRLKRRPDVALYELSLENRNQLAETITKQIRELLSSKT